MSRFRRLCGHRGEAVCARVDNLRFGRAAVLCLSNGSCQCRVTTQSIFLETGFGSIVGNAIAVDAIDLSSGAASLVYETSSLSAFDKASLRSSVPALRFSDDSASSAGVARRTTSAFVTGTLPDASARASGAMPILTATIVVRPIRHKRASQTVLMACSADAKSSLLPSHATGHFVTGLFRRPEFISVELRRLQESFAALQRAMFRRGEPQQTIVRAA
jgi:hypothetical protein